MGLFLDTRLTICLLVFNHFFDLVFVSVTNKTIYAKINSHSNSSNSQKSISNQFERKSEIDITNIVNSSTTAFTTSIVSSIEYCPNQCDCLHFDETIDCSHRRLENLPLFDSHAKRLYLEDNRITFLPPNSFKTAPELLLIVLERNELNFVESISFCGLKKLQELDLGGNRIQSFVVDPTIVKKENKSNFCVAPSLKEINFSLNLLSKLPYELFYFAPNLEILNLSYNEIETIKVDPSYENFKCLKHIDLSRNKILWIGNDDLKALRETSLEIFNLAESSVSKIDKNAFKGFDNLTSLSLANNLIDFNNLNQVLINLLNSNHSNFVLKRLDISEINIPNITMEMVGNFENLIILDASLCDVEVFESEIFNQLQKLETLHLEFGKIKVLENLMAAKNLRRIYLQDNQLSYVNVSGLYNLEIIDLSYNQIEIISEKWMENLKNLQMVNLSHNQIHTIGISSFKQSSVMLSLDLSYNNIETLHSMGLEKVTKIDYSHNSIYNFDQNVFDHLHESLTDIDLSYNNITSFNNSIFEPIHNIQAMNLAGNKLGEFLSLFFKSAKNSPFAYLVFLKYLDLSDNGLFSFHCQLISPLRNLLTLSLRKNNISKLSDINLNCGESLVKLILSNNKLRNVDVSALDALINLEEFDVSSNPFDCNCAILDFLRWANTTQVKIIKEVEDDSYRCHSIGRAIDDSSVPEDTYLFSLSSWTNDDFLFLYRPEYDRCYGNSKKAINPYYDQVYMSSFESNNLRQQAQKVNNNDGKSDAHNYLAAKYFSVFCVTTFAGVLVGMTVIFVAWRFRNCIYQLTVLNSRWRVRYREVSDLESALDSRV